jgi:hypothetical protein
MWSRAHPGPYLESLLVKAGQRDSLPDIFCLEAQSKAPRRSMPMKR